MSALLYTVEQAAQRLALHPKTVLRYIRDGRLNATRVGKSYRIQSADLDSFAGLVSGRADADEDARTTSVTDIPGLTIVAAERMATFLQAAALSGDADTPPLQLQTMFDPGTEMLKVVAIGRPSDIGKLLEMMDLHLRSRP